MFCANCGNDTTEGNDFCTDCQQDQLPGLVRDPALPVMPTAGSIAAQPGWYLDPADPTSQRYWDGIAWSSHTFPASSSTNQPWARFAPVAVKGMSFTEAVRSVLTNYGPSPKYV
jgi:hypothetical protein